MMHPYLIVTTVLLLFIGANGFGITRSNTTLTQARFTLAAVSVGQYAIFAGGRTEMNKVDGTIDIFEVPTLQRTTASLSVPRDSMGVISVGRYAIFAGGAGNGYEVTDQVDIFDASSREWTTTKLSVARSYVSTAAVGNYAVFAGGDNGETSAVYDEVDIFNSSTGQWTTAKLSRKRGRPAGASAGKYALFAGGYNNGRTDVVDIFDSSTLQWTTTTLPKPLGGLVGISFGRYALFVGGLLNGSVYSKWGYLFDSQTLEWTTISVDGRFDGTFERSVTVGQYALLCGYLNDAGVNRSIFILDSSNNWNMTDLKIPARYHNAITSVGNKVFVGGGNSLETQFIVPSDVVDVLDFDSLDIPVQEIAPASKTSSASARGFRLIALMFAFVMLFCS